MCINNNLLPYLIKLNELFDSPSADVGHVGLIGGKYV